MVPRRLGAQPDRTVRLRDGARDRRARRGGPVVLPDFLSLRYDTDMHISIAFAPGRLP